MASIVNPGYMGSAFIDGIGQFRYASSSLAAKQSILAPDMIMGDYDHDAFVYGKVEISGTLSGPVTNRFSQAGGVFEWATSRDECGLLTPHDVLLTYFCGGDGGSRQFKNMVVNSMNFSVQAGDIANFSIDVMGAESADRGSGASGSDDIITDKIITWDQCSIVSSGGFSEAISAFDFTIANNCEPAYALDQATSVGLFPIQIVPGLRLISGTITSYNAPTFEGADFWDNTTNTDTLTFNIGSLAVSFQVKFHRLETASSTGLITSTVGFTGVGHQTF
jgi:hypothetical protein